ncbi:glutamine amidotransferase-related protein [Sphingosinithalassobacter portus]|uniref:glutamine amidotransferase-related protein n=1 Tax=Stakelama portus TaxID=2676234 RepID=UPI000D6E5E5F|nr:glutamine amidotransferase [Sphingosinithalassobacter portus]
MKRCVVVEHIDFEPLAAYRAPIDQAGYAIESVAAAALTGFDWSAPDLLVLMGGPMSVHDGDSCPWMPPEIEGVARRCAADLPTLGICLGGQVMARAMGAEVTASPVREIGFAPLTLTPAGQASALRHFADTSVLHWHGETFAIPPGATHLAASQGCANQAFSRGNLLGLQFHGEIGELAQVEIWLDRGRDYVAGAGVDPDGVRADMARLGAGAVAAGSAAIAEWLTALG